MILIFFNFLHIHMYICIASGILKAQDYTKDTCLCFKLHVSHQQNQPVDIFVTLAELLALRHLFLV